MVSNPSQRLDLKTQQSMIMTQQLQQSIKLLQYSSQELQVFVTKMLENNPLLSQIEGGETEESDEEEDNTLQEWREDHKKETYELTTESDSLYYENVKNTSEEGSTFDALENIPFTQKTLKEHVIEQIYLSFTKTSQRIIAFHLADLLDDNGYLDPAYQALEQSLKCSKSEIDEVLHSLQMLEPAGIFSRSLSECLKLQLIEKGSLSTSMEVLLSNLEKLAAGELRALKKLCQVSEGELERMIAMIKHLNPRPGTLFVSEQSHYIQPDVMLRRSGAGEWIVELNNDALPKLLLNRKYYSFVKSKTKDQSGKKYLSDQLHSANWLLKALDQRAQTILKVATEIVVKQTEFLEYGIRYLKPLRLSDIAQATGLHESTVSRVTTQKYITTPFGIYELKYFFSSYLADSEGGENYSSKTVKHLIKELIENESSENILSDDKIATILKSRHIDVARRTIAKYRESMHIPSSSDRRRGKMIKR